MRYVSAFLYAETRKSELPEIVTHLVTQFIVVLDGIIGISVRVAEIVGKALRNP